MCTGTFSIDCLFVWLVWSNDRLNHFTATAIYSSSFRVILLMFSFSLPLNLSLSLFLLSSPLSPSLSIVISDTSSPLSPTAGVHHACQSNSSSTQIAQFHNSIHIPLFCSSVLDAQYCCLPAIKSFISFIIFNKFVQVFCFRLTSPLASSKVYTTHFPAL